VTNSPAAVWRALEQYRPQTCFWCICSFHGEVIRWRS